ncbi:MAG: DUF3536 domain-containing protein [Candidatus Omnitrophota bacterium]
MNRYICIHGHFYQPPRENPWLEAVELQDSAYPYHDWNQRITAESYAPNTAARILDTDRKIIDIINNYSKISFNIGPTLLSWMERNSPEIYQAILDADTKSRERFSGHGSAIAQVYNHIIMPLANTHDKRTQILWGIKDFERRFKRYPEGMWLAETAVDVETLDILAECGIKFTVLAPRQAHRVRKIDGGRWKSVKDAKVNPKMPYRCHLPSGRSIALFFYDGPVSRDIAFGGLLENGETFANRLMSTFTPDDGTPQLVHVATDGESYGHHHQFGDMALTYCLYHLESHDLAHITIYGEFLEKFPPTYEVEIFENSSWSCIHGVERWKNNCGCNSGGHQDWNQEWRAPLRGAFDWLRDSILKIFEEQTRLFFNDPWKARDDYISVILDRRRENVERFIKENQVKEISHEEKVKIIKLFEAERQAMLMYTSCGWFFDEISGIETVQIIQYAARAIQLIHEVSGISFQEPFVGLLERAPSNISTYKNGAEVYKALVEPSILDLARVGVHYAVSSLFHEYSDTTELYSYHIKSIRYERMEAGKQKLAVGTVSVLSDITLEEIVISFAVMYLGDHNIVGGVRTFGGDEAFTAMYEEIKNIFKKSLIPDLIHAVDKHFSSHSYSIWHLFRDEQRELLDEIFKDTSMEIEVSFRQVYDRYYPVLQAMEGYTIHLPRHFSAVIEFVLNTDLRRTLETEPIDLENFEKLVQEVKRWQVRLDTITLNYIASNRVEQLIQKCALVAHDSSLFTSPIELLRLLGRLPVKLDLWKSQNIYFTVGKDLKQTMQQERDHGNGQAQKWLECFEELGNFLKVRIG